MASRCVFQYQGVALASILPPWLVHSPTANCVSTVSWFWRFFPPDISLYKMFINSRRQSSTTLHGVTSYTTLIFNGMCLSLQQGSYFCTVWVRSVFHAVCLLPTATLSLMDICLLDNKNVVAYLPITDHKPLLWIVKEQSVRPAFTSLSYCGVLAVGDILRFVCACLRRVSQDGCT